MVSFVNPYAFVDVPQAISRGAPSGHACAVRNGVSGVLDVRLTTVSPLLLGAVQGDGGPQPPRDRNGAVFVPGSLLHGAFRSVHEAMAGGCMRVLDLDFVPVHRQPASTSATVGMRLAIVAGVDKESGVPQGFKVTRPNERGRGEVGFSTAWFRLADLRAGLEVPIQSGQRFTIADAEFEEQRGGRVVCRQARVTPAVGAEPGAWRVLITDTHARAEGRDPYFVAGRNFEVFGPVDPRAWSTYLELAAGADDLRPNNRNTDSFPSVYWPSDSTAPADRIGRRYRVGRSVSVGQPMWVRLDGVGAVVEMRPALLWRYKGQGAVRDRIPNDDHTGVQACHDWTRLCPSCRLFGSADTRVGLRREVSEQHSYRGHVNFSDALVEDEQTLRSWQLAPLGSPRPSAGQFYLDHGALSGERVRGAPRQVPLGHWGSTADDRTARRIRGRKFYHRTADPEAGGFARGRAREWQLQSDARMAKDVTLIGPRAVFTFRVAFDNLTPDQLGALLACLQPEVLFPDSRYPIVVSLGGAKPFGFGAVSTAVTITDARSAASRYLGEPADIAVESGALVESFTATVDPAVRARIWPQLGAVLSYGAVPDEQVWYPHAAGKVRGTKDYDEGFEFWKESAGVSTKLDGGPTVRTRLTGPPPLPGPQQIDLDAPRRER